MKKILASLLFVACLGFACNASAAVQEFGPDFARFTIDVKDGWTAQAIDNGVQVAKADQSCVIAITVVKSNGMTAENFCKGVVEAAGVKDAKEVSKDGSTCSYSGSKDGVNMVITTAIEGEKAAVFVIGGTNLEASSEIIDTLKDK
jgi:hypothetical protein